MIEQVVVGVDPGRKGAAVVLHLDGTVHTILHMPLLKLTRGKVGFDVAAIAKFVRSLPTVRAFAVERVGAGPSMSGHATAVLLENAGTWVGCASMLGCEVLRPRPQEWRFAALTRAGITAPDGGKAPVTEAARMLLPELATVLTKGAAQGVADAALIADWARRRM